MIIHLTVNITHMPFEQSVSFCGERNTQICTVEEFKIILFSDIEKGKFLKMYFKIELSISFWVKDYNFFYEFKLRSHLSARPY